MIHDSSVGPQRSDWGQDARIPPEVREAWVQDGLIVFPGLVSSERVDRHNELVAAIRSEVPNGRDEHGLGDRIGQLHQRVPDLLDTVDSPRLQHFLRWALDDQPLLFASLNFDRGTQQEEHVDLIYFCTDPLYAMVGVWIALEDVKIDAGPLFYHLGSHHWNFPYLDDSGDAAAVQRKAGDSPAAPEIVQGRAQTWLNRLGSEVKERGSVRQPMLVRKGDVVIWHAKLAHGGMPRNVPELSRKSVVYHFIGEKSRLYSFEDFFSYPREELLKRPGVGVPIERRGELRYQRHSYFVTYDDGKELVHQL